MTRFIFILCNIIRTRKYINFSIYDIHSQPLKCLGNYERINIKMSCVINLSYGEKREIIAINFT